MPEADEPEEMTSEAQALADILAWSEQRPLWQRDALRRLLDSEHLSDEEIASLMALCKDRTRPAAPLTADHIRMPVAGEPTVYLRAVRNALNINALAEGQRLSCLPNGVTIVYGDNGSGKSGYVRILKRVCRARGPDERIFKNIYTAPPGPQQAEIDFTVGGQDQTERWTNGEPFTPISSAVSVFDARTASIHVDETNDLAYTPFPIKLLERLVQTCRAVKTRLDAEIAALKAQTPHALTAPDCSADTAVGQLIARLSESTTQEEVETLATLAPQEVARLETLTTDLAQDPRATSLSIGVEF